jgi:hypothetical protein
MFVNAPVRFQEVRAGAYEAWVRLSVSPKAHLRTVHFVVEQGPATCS